MNKILSMLVIVFAFAFGSSAISRAQSIPNSFRVASPDGRLEVTFALLSDRPMASEGQLSYSIAFKGKPVIVSSSLDLDLAGSPGLGRIMRFTGASRRSVDQTYRLLTGKTSVVRDWYQGLALSLIEAGHGGRELEIEVRAYDDAIAFRYVVPKQAGLPDFRLLAERTEFRFAKDATAFALELANFRTSYESEFVSLPLSAFAHKQTEAPRILIGLPTLIQIPGVAWAAITEADLDGYAAMYLVNPTWRNFGFESRLAPQMDHPEICVTGPLPHHSAWRVIQVATDPGRLVESNVVTSLNPECAIADTSWIRSGKAAWEWWSGSLGPDGRHAFATATMKYYVDFAARSHFEYMLIDADWSPRDDILVMNGRVDVPEVVRYAAGKGVKIWIWADSHAVWRQMYQAFPLYEKWGLAGVKIDFVERDDQAGIAFYSQVAKLAARHHLMLDFHGATKPTGLERTWPNILGYEAVLGMEHSKVSARDNPPLRLNLPFTRMLAGPMDYTPGGFRNVTAEDFVARNIQPLVLGTRAQQLAMYVVYQAAFQMVSDWPAAYEGQPAFEFIKSVPSTWDETRVLLGYPGSHIAMARRSGQTWFCGAMTDWSPRHLSLPLSFLGPKQYRAIIYADAADAARHPEHVVVKEREVNASTRLDCDLAPGGGCAVVLRPIP